MMKTKGDWILSTVTGTRMVTKRTLVATESTVVALRVVVVSGVVVAA